MIQGYNHNVRYGGRLFHLQTEDSGLANPHVITHLYHGGTIVASRKTSYADIVRHERRDEVIRELMREQHRQMLLDLRDGRLDATLAGFGLGPSRQEAPAPSPSRPGRLPASADSSAASADDILLDYLASRTGPDGKKASE